MKLSGPSGSSARGTDIDKTISSVGAHTGLKPTLCDDGAKPRTCRRRLQSYEAWICGSLDWRRTTRGCVQRGSVRVVVGMVGIELGGGGAGVRSGWAGCFRQAGRWATERAEHVSTHAVPAAVVGIVAFAAIDVAGGCVQRDCRWGVAGASMLGKAVSRRWSI